VGEDEPDVAAGARVADGADPAELMVDEAAPVISRGGGFDDFCAESHSVPGAVDAGTEFIVVGEVVDQGGKSADFFEGFAADGEG